MRYIHGITPRESLNSLNHSMQPHEGNARRAQDILLYMQALMLHSANAANMHVTYRENPSVYIRDHCQLLEVHFYTLKGC